MKIFQSIKKFHKDERGLTLMEVLVVLAILGVFTLIAVPRISRILSSTKNRAAAEEMRIIESTLFLYHTEKNIYPESISTLADDGFFKTREILKDPWGREYEYRCPGQNGDYDIICYGADGVEGGEGDNADIVSW